MKFVYNGTTWTCSDSDYPNYPVGVPVITDTDRRRSWDGTARRHTNWNKSGRDLAWNTVGSSVKDRVSTWEYLDGTITVYDKHGTIHCHAEGYSCQEITLDSYDIGITLREV